MDRYEQDLDLTELNNDLSLDDILSEYQADAPFVPSPAPQAEPEDDPDDGFFRIAGEAVGRIRRTSPKQQPVPDPEHFWDPPVVPVQEEPARDEGQFWDLPDLTVQEEPALETEPSAPPAEKKSALPSEDEIRAYMASFARGDYSDMDAGQSAPYREPEIDPRFLTKADYAQGPDVMMYGDNETDILSLIHI